MAELVIGEVAFKGADVDTINGARDDLDIFEYAEVVRVLAVAAAVMLAARNETITGLIAAAIAA